MSCFICWKGPLEVVAVKPRRMSSFPACPRCVDIFKLTTEENTVLSDELYDYLLGREEAWVDQLKGHRTEDDACTAELRQGLEYAKHNNAYTDLAMLIEEVEDKKRKAEENEPTKEDELGENKKNKVDESVKEE